MHQTATPGNRKAASCPSSAFRATVRQPWAGSGKISSPRLSPSKIPRAATSCDTLGPSKPRFMSMSIEPIWRRSPRTSHPRQCRRGSSAAALSPAIDRLLTMAPGRVSAASTRRWPHSPPTAKRRISEPPTSAPVRAPKNFLVRPMNSRLPSGPTGERSVIDAADCGSRAK
jgi:hypothetical protein